MRIKLPGIFLALLGIAGMVYVALFREEWGWPEMGVLGVITLIGLARTFRGA